MSTSKYRFANTGRFRSTTRALSTIKSSVRGCSRSRNTKADFLILSTCHSSSSAVKKFLWKSKPRHLDVSRRNHWSHGNHQAPWKSRRISRRTWVITEKSFFFQILQQKPVDLLEASLGAVTKNLSTSSALCSFFIFESFLDKTLRRPPLWSVSSPGKGEKRWVSVSSVISRKIF